MFVLIIRIIGYIMVAVMAALILLKVGGIVFYLFQGLSTLFNINKWRIVILKPVPNKDGNNIAQIKRIKYDTKRELQQSFIQVCTLLVVSYIFYNVVREIVSIGH